MFRLILHVCTIYTTFHIPRRAVGTRTKNYIN